MLIPIGSSKSTPSKILTFAVQKGFQTSLKYFFEIDKVHG